jgi:hypothetical protein
MARLKEDIDEERKYQQLRVRLGLRADVNESVQAVIRLASASSAISTNQTMGDSSDPGGARRSFGLDVSYIDWRLADSFYAWAGRTANPFWSPAKVQTLFDSDLAFEGIALKLDPKTGFFASAGGFMISENYVAPSDSVDTGQFGAEVGARFKFGGNSTLTFHAGNHYFLNVRDSNITRMDKDAKIDPYSYPFDRYRGNTLRVNDPLLPLDQRKYFFASEFVLLQAGAEWKQAFGPIEYTLFGEAIENNKTVTRDKALEYGGIFKWKWLSATYAEIVKEPDSVLGAFTDSDSNGGGTDNEGRRIAIGIQFGKNAYFNTAHYFGSRGVDSVKRDFSSTHMDLAVGF